MRSVGSDEILERAEGLRLFRHAEDPKSLDKLVNYTRTDGPLEALKQDAERVIEQRSSPPRLRTVELTILSAAAEVLDGELASRGLGGVLEYIGAGVPAFTQRWEADSVRLERAWQAAVSLSIPSGRLGEASSRLLSAVQDAPPDDWLLQQALTRVSATINWEDVPSEVCSSWREWLESSDSEMAKSLWRAVGPELATPGISFGKEEPSLEDVGAALNLVLTTGEAIPARYAEEAAARASEALSEIRTSAAPFAFHPSILDR
jgi:hypothetical protein